MAMAGNVLQLDEDALGPVYPVAPAGPVAPVSPVAPKPVAPVKPVEPVEPTAPVGPVAPVMPVAPVEPVAPAPPVIATPFTSTLHPAPLTRFKFLPLVIVMLDPDADEGITIEW